MQGSFLWSNRL